MKVASIVAIRAGSVTARAADNGGSSLGGYRAAATEQMFDDGDDRSDVTTGFARHHRGACLWMRLDLIHRPMVLLISVDPVLWSCIHHPTGPWPAQGAGAIFVAESRQTQQRDPGRVRG